MCFDFEESRNDAFHLLFTLWVNVNVIVFTISQKIIADSLAR